MRTGGNRKKRRDTGFRDREGIMPENNRKMGVTGMDGSKTTKDFPTEIKWTKQRKRVYEILDQASEPLSAAQIHARLTPKEQETYAISTIYRILAAFEGKHLVDKTAWMGDGTGVYELRRDSHTHYAICLDCHKRIPLEHCPLHMTMGHPHEGKEEEGLEEFQVVSHRIELYGYCKDCRKNHA